MPPTPSGSTGFFTTRELLRLSSAIFLLGIVGLDFLPGLNSSSSAMMASNLVAEDSIKQPAVPAKSSWTERIVKHPGHTDKQEVDALKAELQVVSDRTPLDKMEMPAYWRMVNWAYAAPGDELQKQAQSDLLLNDLIQAPHKHRGKLVDVELKVRLMRQHDAPENSANIKQVYEAWGPTEESRTFPYCVVFADIPPGVEVKGAAFFNARFVGFFLKNIAYEDATGAKRSAPLIIGRMIVERPEVKPGAP